MQLIHRGCRQYQLNALTVAAAGLAFTAALLVTLEASAQEQPSLLELPPIVVEAQGVGSLTVPATEEAQAIIRRTPGGVALVPDSQWQESPAATVKDMLDFTPGVFAQPKVGNDARLSIRGSGLSRYYHLRGLNLYQDGVPLNNADGSSDFQWINPTAYRYVEVYKGANALRYGSGTLGGAINFVSPTGRDADSLQARADIGSFGWRRLQLSASIEESTFDGFITAAAQRQKGFREQSAGDAQHIRANLGWRLAEHVETRFYLAGLRVRQELPGSLSRAQALRNPHQAATANVADNWQHNVDGGRLSNRTVLISDDTRYEFGGWFSNSHLDHPIYEYLDHDRTDYGLFTRLENTSSLAGRDNRYTLGLTWSAGHIVAEQFENHGGRKGAQTNKTRDQARNITLYGENAFDIVPEVSLIAGLQYLHAKRKRTDRFNASPESGEKNYNLLNPMIGILWQPKELVQIYGNITRSGEPPTFGDLQFGSRDALDRLKPQRATTFEVGTRGQYGNLSWDLALYHARLKNEFQCVSLWNICSLTINLDRTIHQGVEAGLNWTFLQNLLVQGNDADSLSVNTAYTFSDFHFDNDPTWGSNVIPGIPRHYVRSELLYAHPNGFYAASSVEWVPQAFYVDNANSLKTAPYALLNARVGWRRGFYSFFIEGRNLTDRKYIASASITDVAASDPAVFEPGSGRGVYTGIQIQY